MKKKIQKKQTYPQLVKAVKFLFLTVIIIFSFLLLKSNSVDLSSFSFGADKKNKPINEYIPQKLKWGEDFRGISNVKDKNAKGSGEGKNFLQYESSK